MFGVWHRNRIAKPVTHFERQIFVYNFKNVRSVNYSPRIPRGSQTKEKHHG